MLTKEPIFPATIPPFYERVEEQSQWPSGAITTATPRPLICMKDLGYESSTSIAQLQDVLISEPVEIISASAATVLRESILRLRASENRPAGSPPTHVIRAAAYRSAVIRNFCLDNELADFVGRAMRRPVVATALVHQVGITNFTELPDTGGAPVDIGGWHIDQNAYVIVMSLGGMDGARHAYLEYFEGSREEGLQLLLTGQEIPGDRVKKLPLPGPGWGVVMHSSLVLHRAGPAIGPLHRISMVTAFEPRDVTIPDQNQTCLVEANGPQNAVQRCEREARAVEFARHKAWRAKGHLDDFLNRDLWGLSAEEIVGQLTACAKEIVEYVQLIRRGEVSDTRAFGEYLAKTGSLPPKPNGTT